MSTSGLEDDAPIKHLNMVAKSTIVDDHNEQKEREEIIGDTAADDCPRPDVSSSSGFSQDGLRSAPGFPGMSDLLRVNLMNLMKITTGSMAFERWYC